MTPMDTQIPHPALVLLVGQSGSGKSTLAGTWPATEVLELDHYRALVADDFSVKFSVLSEGAADAAVDGWVVEFEEDDVVQRSCRRSPRSRVSMTRNST